MKINKLICLIFTLFFLTTPALSRELTKEDIQKLPKISAMQALYLHKQKKILLLDVHDNQKGSPILGAYYIPSKKIEKVKLKIPKNQLIGVFCD